jgi:copper chaperone CopZ
MKREIGNGAALAAAVVVVALGVPWLLHEVRTLPRSVPLAARADQRIVTLDVGGMTCAGCAAKIQTTLAEVPGVRAVEVRLAQRQALIVCERSVTDAALTAAVGRAGPGYLAAPARD